MKTRLAALLFLAACGGGATGPDPGDPDPNPVGLGAGASLGGRRPFPDGSPWNRDVSADPVDPASATLIASCGATARLHPDFGTVWEGAPNGIPYVVVSGSQGRVPVTFDYADESDPGPYPTPPTRRWRGGRTVTATGT